MFADFPVIIDGFSKFLIRNISTSYWPQNLPWGHARSHKKMWSGLVQTFWVLLVYIKQTNQHKDKSKIYSQKNNKDYKEPQKTLNVSYDLKLLFDL